MTQPFSAAPESSHKSDELLKQSERFPNLRVGGQMLALKLDTYRDQSGAIVLGIALGGVPVAHEVAAHLNLPLDLLLVRRLLAPEGPDSHGCAVNVAGLMINDNRLKPAAEPATPLEHFVTESLREFEQRVRMCRRERPAINLKGQTVIVIDCGIRTGSTINAAVRAIRTLQPKKIVAGVPVTSIEGCALAEELADEFFYLSKPQTFVNAGFWYQDFKRPGDEEVGELL